MRVAGVVLAAGAGTRLGSPKALLASDGERFVDRAVRVLHEGGADPVFVVVGAAEVGHVDAIVVANPLWHAGLGSSLETGLRAASAYAADVADLDAVIVLLVDQPGMTPAAVARVLAAEPAAPAVVATYGGERRHPVRLAAAIWAEVAAVVEGDHGARTYLASHPDDVVEVPCQDVADPADVDTPEDLAGLT